ncbi:alpha-mannosidase [Elysia marginata]|uniref:mannosyl-oligosaccharide 1,3-1,6-alpha-mannosidase n=1 Tax=Elysia marginata TaxID=1093978 RepID=A0AAV4IN19_9GAST|nr:alpha-mannosidase [Elysia marginata]
MIDVHFWRGYYTSRPLQKNLDRVLEHNLRSAEIVFSLSQARAWRDKLANFPSLQLARKVEGSRRALALFQHHDGITGTAKDHVVEDYGRRLLNGLHDAKRVVAECAAFLLHEDKKAFSYSETEGSEFNLDETRENHDSLPEKPTLKVKDAVLPGGSPVIVYNSLAQARVEVVSVHTDWPYVKITGPDGLPVHSQVEPVWPKGKGHESSGPTLGIYSVKFVANLTGLAITKYLVHKVDSGQDRHNHIAQIILLNKNSGVADYKPNVFPIDSKSDDGEFVLETNFLKATFSGITGRLKSVTSKSDGVTHKSELEFIQYSTRAHRDKSGAYLFLPDGEARPLVSDRPALIRIVKGPLGSEVTIFSQYIEHSVRLHNSPGLDGSSVEISNIVDIRGSRNLEVGMRLHTNVKNSDRTFYSDLNGFQMQKRKYYSKLTLQGNVYPMPTMAYLQDEGSRVSVLASQSSGVGNLVEGAIDVMFDRRLNQDDNRGLGQGVMDNHPTPSRYRLLLETRHTRVQETAPDTSFPSLLGQLSSLSLIHPMFVMPQAGRGQGEKSGLVGQVLLMRSPLSCEMHLLNLRRLLHSSVTAEWDSPALLATDRLVDVVVTVVHVVVVVVVDVVVVAVVHVVVVVVVDVVVLTVVHVVAVVVVVDVVVTVVHVVVVVVVDVVVTVVHEVVVVVLDVVNPATMFSDVELRQSTITSLTMTSDLAELKPGTAVQVPPMEILAVKVDLS